MLCKLRQAIDALVNLATEWQLSISVNKCNVLNVGRVTHSTNLNIDGTALPVVSTVRNLGILMSYDLLPPLHISSIVRNAHKRSSAICRNVDLLVRAYLTYK